MTNRGNRAPAFGLGVVVGGLLVGMFALTVTTSTSLAGAGREQHSHSAGPARHLQARALRECRAFVDHQTRALNAADASLAQWKVHVDAMNKLVAGKITLAQAQAFWNQTRVGAKRLLARYQAAALAFGNLDAGCPTERAAKEHSRALRECRAAVTAKGQALQAADTAIATWSHHVQDMDMLRTGRLSPAKATRMWMMNWRTGVKQIHAYQVAARHARGQTC